MRHSSWMVLMLVVASYVGAAKPIRVAVCPEVNSDMSLHLVEQIELGLEKIETVLVEACAQPDRPRSTSLDVLLRVELVKVNHQQSILICAYDRKDIARWCKQEELLLDKQRARTLVSEVSGVIQSFKSKEPVPDLFARKQKEINKFTISVDDISTTQKSLKVHATERLKLGSLDSDDDDWDLPLMSNYGNPASQSYKGSIGVLMGAEKWIYKLKSPVQTFKDSYNSGGHPSLLLRADYWPSKWLGFSLDVSIGMATFRYENGKDIEIIKSSLNGLYGNVLGRFKLVDKWYVMPYIGYQTWLTFTSWQYYGGRLVTFVPGFIMHGPHAGLIVSSSFFRDKLSVSVSGGIVPIMFYLERPDTPGSEIEPIAWWGNLGARYLLTHNWFLEIFANWYELNGAYKGEGTRRNQNYERISDAEIQNISLMLLAGIGWQFY